MSIASIGVIGAGSMGGSFVRGWLKADSSFRERLIVADALPEAAQRLAGETGISVAGDNRQLVERSDLVLLAVKPADVESALADSINSFSGKALASIVAGRSITSLEMLFAQEIAIMRLMPNVAVEVQAGTICFAAGNHVGARLEGEAVELFGRLGKVVQLPEKLFGAATAVSGSGPGFLAVIMDAFVDAGVTAGLSPATAAELAFSMMEGTSRLLTETAITPTELRRRVTSPAGTTAAGIAELEREGVRSAIIRAVQAALKRSGELG